MASYRGIDHHEGIPTTGAPGPDDATGSRGATSSGSGGHDGHRPVGDSEVAYLVHRYLAVNGFGRSLKEFEEEAAVLLAPMKDVSERVDA